MAILTQHKFDVQHNALNSLLPVLEAYWHFMQAGADI